MFKHFTITFSWWSLTLQLDGQALHMSATERNNIKISDGTYENRMRQIKRNGTRRITFNSLFAFLSLSLCFREIYIERERQNKHPITYISMFVLLSRIVCFSLSLSLSLYMSHTISIFPIINYLNIILYIVKCVHCLTLDLSSKFAGI